MRTESFNGILLSILMTVSLMAPVITVSLLSVSLVSANPGLENIVRAGDTAYNLDGDETPPWRWYGPDEPEQNPPIMAAKRVDSGAVVAAGFVASCRGSPNESRRWNATSNPYPHLDDLLDSAFQWMVPGAENVLWYGETTPKEEGEVGIDYNVFNDAYRCEDLITALRNKEYTVDNTWNGVFDNITAELLENCEILVIPQMELGDAGTGGDPDELPDGVVDVIEDFVRAGGGLLIMDGYDTFGYNYCWVQNKILKRFEFGIYFQSDYITDEAEKLWYTHSITADVDNTTWIGENYENATKTTKIGLYITSSLAERGDYEVSVKVSPGYRTAFPNTAVKYTVSVLAPGWKAPDNINLSVTSTWPAKFPNDLTTIKIENVGLKLKETTLMVTIPSGTAFGAEDEITVTATSEGDSNVSLAKKCKATASMRIGPPVEDTFVDQMDPDPLGTYIWMQVGSGPDNNKSIYLKFDLSALPEGAIPPDGKQIDDIHARLFAWCEFIDTEGSFGENVQCWAVENDDWDEDVMYWHHEEPKSDTLLYTTEVSEQDYWYSWDVTNFVIAEYRDDNKASFCLKAENENIGYPDSFPGYSFASSNGTESWHHPYLVIGYDVSTSISPDYDGLPGGTLTYDINVWNRGSESDSYTLYLDNVWETTLSDDRIVNLGPMETKTETLTVEIPVGAAIGDNDLILVTAVPDGYPAENDIGTCIARASSHVSSWKDSSTIGCDEPTHHLENSLWGRDNISVGRYEDAPERGWLKFDLQAFPAGMTVTRANLNLNCYSTYGANVRVYGVGDDSWSEYTINWLNKPPIDNVLDRRAVIENNKWYSWDVTDFVANEYAGDKVASFCLLDIGENVAPNHTARFRSKEHRENWPYLEILTALPENEVRANVDPIFQGDLAGATLNYTITVMNNGTLGDNYDLTVENTKPWSLTLKNDNLEVPAGENRTTKLSVTIPIDENICTINDITITVTSRENENVYDNIRCSAHRSWAKFGLENIYKVSLDIYALLRDDANNLVAKFYSYGDTFDNENVLWSTMPAYLKENVMDIPHPEFTVALDKIEAAVEKVKLVLTDDEGNTIQTFSTFVVTKTVLESRFSDIPMEWSLYAQERPALEEEFSNIPMQWSLAPS